MPHGRTGQACRPLSCPGKNSLNFPSYHSQLRGCLKLFLAEFKARTKFIGATQPFFGHKIISIFWVFCAKMTFLGCGQEKSWFIGENIFRIPLISTTVFSSFFFLSLRAIKTPKSTSKRGFWTCSWVCLGSSGTTRPPGATFIILSTINPVDTPVDTKITVISSSFS